MAWTQIGCTTASWDDYPIIADWTFNGMPIGLLLALTYSHLALPDWNNNACIPSVWTTTT